MRVPIDLRIHFMRSEIKRSLGTKCYCSAKSLVKKFIAESERVFTMIRSGALTDKMIQKIVSEYIELWISTFDKKRDNEIISSDPKEQRRIEQENKLFNALIAKDEGYESMLSTYDEGIKKDRVKLGRRKGHEDERIMECVDVALYNHDLKIAKDSTEYKSLCNKLLQGRIEAGIVIKEHLAGNYNTDYDIEIKTRQQYPSLKELISLYEKDKQCDWNDSKRIKSAHRQILHIIGNVPINTIDRGIAIKLRDALKEYPRNVSEKDMSLSWKQLSKTRATRLSESSQHYIKTAFATLIKYAIKHAKGITGNPADGIAGKKPDPESPSEPYTNDELQGLVIALSHLDRTKEPEMFWIPLLLLYTGSRANEICMLRCDDIENIQEKWVIQFRNKIEYNQRTKRKVDRRSPIHNDLIEIGFLDYVNKQKFRNHDRLFSNLKLTDDKWIKDFGKAYNRTFKHKFLKNYTKEQLHVKTLHSFRKTFITWYVQHKEFQDFQHLSTLQSVIGHMENKEIAFILNVIEQAKLTLETYGGGFNKLELQVELLQHLDYGIDLSPLTCNSIEQTHQTIQA